MCLSVVKNVQEFVFSVLFLFTISSDLNEMCEYPFVAQKQGTAMTPN